MSPILSRSALGAGLLVGASICGAQNSGYVEKPHFIAPIRPYAPPGVPAVSLHNSKRIHDLMRAGK
jgi:hypothetical protein